MSKKRNFFIRNDGAKVMLTAGISLIGVYANAKNLDIDLKSGPVSVSLDQTTDTLKVQV